MTTGDTGFEGDSAAAAKNGPRLVLVTGMSGAGRSSALRALEDLGFEAVDNMPLTLLDSLVASSGGRHGPRLAVGVDVRTRDFGTEPLIERIGQMIDGIGLDVSLLFLDCGDEELRRRFTETRRPHPLAADRPVADGIAHERRMLAELRDRADIVIDTSDLAPGDLRRLLKGYFGGDAGLGLTLFVTSFSYRRGIPREADLVFDVRFLANPHYQDELRPLTGCDGGVAAFIEGDAAFGPFFKALTSLLEVLLPGYQREGKSYLTVAVGCTGGRHRSVCVAERLTGWLRETGHKVDIAHRDMERS